MKKSKVKEIFWTYGDVVSEPGCILEDYNNKLINLLLDEQKNLINWYNNEDISNNFSAYSYSIIMDIYLKITKHVLHGYRTPFTYIKKTIENAKNFLDKYASPLDRQQLLDKYRILSELLHFAIQYHLMEIKTFNDDDEISNNRSDYEQYINYYKYMNMVYEEIFINPKYSKFLVYDANDVINNPNNNNFGVDNTSINTLQVYQYLNKCFSKYADDFIHEKTITSNMVSKDILMAANSTHDREVVTNIRSVLKDFHKILLSYENDYKLSSDKIKITTHIIW